MTKRNSKLEHDDSEQAIQPEAADFDSGAEWELNSSSQSEGVPVTLPSGATVHISPVSQLSRLIESGVVNALGAKPTFRTGHLEHLAREFATDPKRAERDYSDDLFVVRSLYQAEFDALVEAAQGE